jgi:hypothetical protein
MSTDRDTTRIVRSWLRSDEHESADHVLDAVLDRLDTTPQRRTTWWPARRLPEMNSFAKFGVAAAVVVVAALLGFNYLVAPNVGGPGLDDPSPTPLPVEPTPEPTAASRTQEIIPNGIPDMRLTVTVPSHWTAFEGWALNGTDVAPPAGYGMGFWGIANLYADPLDRSAGLAEPIGPTVDDLVEALVSHPGWTATEPTPVTIDGYAGMYLEVTVPDDVTFGDCDPDNGFWMWTTPTAGQRCAQAPGQIHHMWVLDVDGERLVIAGLSFPDTAEADREAVIAVAESAQIERGP